MKQKIPEAWGIGKRATKFLRIVVRESVDETTAQPFLFIKD